MSNLHIEAARAAIQTAQAVAGPWSLWDDDTMTDTTNTSPIPDNLDVRGSLSCWRNNVDPHEVSVSGVFIMASNINDALGQEVARRFLEGAIREARLALNFLERGAL